MSDISYTWEEYIDLNEKLVAMVAKSGWQFDSILCLSRGGMRPGDFFSRVYDMPLAVLATSSYRVAVLWYKAHSVLVPDWHVEYLEDNPWIHQPFECYDALGPAKLIELVEAKEAAKKA